MSDEASEGFRKGPLEASILSSHIISESSANAASQEPADPTRVPSSRESGLDLWGPPFGQHHSLSSPFREREQQRGGEGATGFSSPPLLASGRSPSFPTPALVGSRRPPQASSSRLVSEQLSPLMWKGASPPSPPPSAFPSSSAFWQFCFKALERLGGGEQKAEGEVCVCVFGGGCSDGKVEEPGGGGLRMAL